MLKGDLSSTTVAQVLLDLAGGAATGCLHVLDPAGQSAKAYLRAGRVYAVLAPGSRPQLGARLVSSGALGPEALAEALEAQRTELQGWRLGELLVHLGYVDQPVVEAFVNEQVRESLTALLPWRNGTWKFRANERTREDVAPPISVEELLSEIDSRLTTWATIEQTVHGPESVPVLSAAGTADSELEVDADAWSLLCKVDGQRTITELARECGFTLYEAGQVVYTLVGAGLLEVEDDTAEELEPVVSDLIPAAIAGRLVSALSGAATQSDVMSHTDQVQVRHLELPHADDAVSGSISRVSEALASLLGPATADDDIFNTPLRRPAPVAPLVPEDPKRAERARREAVRRAHDSEELQAAQAELEAARTAEQERRDDLLPVGHVADVVDLDAVRAAARVEDVRHAAEQAERVEAQRVAQEREAAVQIEAQRVEAERVASEQAEAELERLAAERAETERVETERVETERVETERVETELERLAAERAETERAEAEFKRLAAERAETERAEAELERLAAERAETERAEAERVENERLAAELVEAQRVEAERAAAAEAEAAAQRAEQARDEADRAEQEAARAEFAEASRLADERAAAEQAEAEARAQAAAAELAAFSEDDETDTEPPDREAQAAAFAELSASASQDLPAPAPTAAPEPTYDDAPFPTYGGANDTDTASLLRELSSLGHDDEPPTPVRPSRPAGPRPVQPAPKKKKGLFGRG